MNKVKDLAEVVDQIEDGSVLMIGGFLACGTPHRMVDRLIERGVKNLTIIANDTSFEDLGLGRLVASKQASRVIVSHIGTNRQTGDQMNAGELDVELVPQGTLAERIRAKGAGLGGVLTPTGLGTSVEEGKQKVTVDGQEYILEKPLGADYALLYGTKVDTFGNIFYEKTTKNFNPLMATAADKVFVEADEIVEVGELDQELVMTPGIFVDAVVGGK